MEATPPPHSQLLKQEKDVDTNIAVISELTIKLALQSYGGLLQHHKHNTITLFCQPPDVPKRYKSLASDSVTRRPKAIYALKRDRYPSQSSHSGASSRSR